MAELADTIANLNDVTFPAFGLACSLPSTDEFTRVVAQELSNVASSMPCFAGMAEIVATLAMSYPTYIVSASPDSAIQAVLNDAGCGQNLAGILGCETAGTKSQKLAQIRARHQPIEQLVMVGDAVSDIRASHAVGAHSVAVGWGWQPASRLLAEKPDAFANHVDELLPLLSRLIIEPVVLGEPR